MILYLIAHKVRGEPAFDVAVKMEMPDGPWWIIPTSGHRAYPFWNMELSKAIECDWQADAMPTDLRDHYDVSRDPPAPDYTNRATDSPRSGRPRVPTLEDI
jgi:hypothetical protein